jgi:hypothetical protein
MFEGDDIGFADSRAVQRAGGVIISLALSAMMAP